MHVGMLKKNRESHYIDLKSIQRRFYVQFSGSICFIRMKQGVKLASKVNAPNGIRIHVAGLKGRCPGPLDDGGVPVKYIREALRRQYIRA
jgi:hypothetical protein